VSDVSPGWVEVHIDLADGSIAQVFDSAPRLSADDHLLQKDLVYPVPLTLDCDVSRIKTEAGTVRASLRRGMSDPAGLATFIVREQDILSDDD
jgi:hypothetical protein